MHYSAGFKHLLLADVWASALPLQRSDTTHALGHVCADRLVELEAGAESYRDARQDLDGDGARLLAGEQVHHLRLPDDVRDSDEGRLLQVARDRLLRLNRLVQVAAPRLHISVVCD